MFRLVHLSYRKTFGHYFFRARTYVAPVIGNRWQLSGLRGSYPEKVGSYPHNILPLPSIPLSLTEPSSDIDLAVAMKREMRLAGKKTETIIGL